MRSFTWLLALLVCLAPQASSQVQVSTRHVRFTTHEGSWLSFDVSHDGRWIVFDLLGQIWRLPIEGGSARAITDVVRDSAEFLDPNFAPDGKSVIAHGEYRGRSGVFLISTSDKSVRWIAPDSLERVERIHSPSWARDARHIVFARGDAAASGQGAQPMAVIERDVQDGNERQIEITGVPAAAREGLTYSADGSEIFFNTREPADVFPSAGRIWRVRTGGGAATLVTRPGIVARAPSPSPDGKRVAYFVMDSTSHAQVWVQNLADSSSAQRVTDDVDVMAIHVRWLPDSETLLYVANGRLWRLNTRTRARREIPFSATVDFTHKVANLPAIHFPSPGERVAARGTRGFALAPDGRSFAVITLDGLWVVPTNSSAGAPRKLASVPPTAANPAWSPDGRRIAWQAGSYRAEDLFITNTGTGRTTRLTSLPGTEQVPVWSPDGQHIVFTHMMRDSTGQPIVRLRSVRDTDSLVRSVAETIDLGPAAPPYFTSPPQWGQSGAAVLLLAPQQNVHKRIASLRFLDGSARREVTGLPYDATYVQWLAGDTLAFLAAARIWRAPFDVAKSVVGAATPVSDDAAAYLSASRNGDLLYVSEDGLRLRSPQGVTSHIGWPIKYTVPTPPPIIIRNVRIIDGTGAAVTAPRDILIERGRFRRIASAGMIPIPTGTTIVDAGGRVAIPGLIDLHTHDYTPAQLRGELYFGVTTTRELTGGQMIAERDAVASGVWPGPRSVISTGRFYADDPFTVETSIGLNPEADAHHLERGIQIGSGFANDWVKNYANAHFSKQVRVTVAAHARGQRVTGHCAYPLTLVAAGIDGKEHLGWQCTLHDAGRWYDDLIQLYARAGISVVPTLAYFNTLEPLHGTRSLPQELAGMFGAELPQVVGSIAEKSWGSAWNLNTANAMDAARKLHAAGVSVGTGTDFEMPDAEHYELQALVNASLSPLEAIAAATSVSARIIAASADVGKIAPGLLGDMVILNADPTTDICNTRQIWRVIQGGRVVDREQLYSPGWDTTGLP